MTASSWLDFQWAFTTATWALAGVAAIALWFALLKDRSRGRRRCPKCWYDMYGVPGLKCPECGRTAKRERQLFSTRRRWKLAALGVLLATLGIGLHYTPRTLEDGIASAVPIPVLNFVLGYWDETGDALYEQHITKPAESRQQVLAPLSRFERLLIASRIPSTGAGKPRAVPPALEKRRSVYCTLLSQLGGELRPALPILFDCARDIDPTVRKNCVELIASCAFSGSERATRLLQELCCQSDDSEVRETAIYFLGLQCRLVPRTRGLFTNMDFPGSTNEYDQGIARALADSATLSRDSSDELRSLLGSPRKFVRLGALEGIIAAKLPHANLAERCSQLIQSDESMAVRSAAAQSAPILYGGEACLLQALEAGVLSADDSLSSQCVASFRTLAADKPEFLEVVTRIVKSNVDPNLRATLLPDAGRCSRDEYRELLRSLIDDDSSSVVRAVALRYLPQVLAGPDDISYIANRLSDPETEVVHAAADCLGRIGPAAAPHLEALKAVRSHSDSGVRSAVEAAIQKVEQPPSDG